MGKGKRERQMAFKGGCERGGMGGGRGEGGRWRSGKDDYEGEAVIGSEGESEDLEEGGKRGDGKRIEEREEKRGEEKSRERKD